MNKMSEDLKDFEKNIFRLKIQETGTFELLSIAGCIGYDEEKSVDDNVVTSEAGAQTEIRWQRHTGTACPPDPSLASFSSQVSETILFDEFNPADNKGLGLRQTTMIMSRILASNVGKPFEKELKKFKNDPLDTDVQFSYTVFTLAQLKDPKLKSVEVAAIVRNPLLDYLYAAGFANGCAGGVALVSLKNTLHAEKIYRLKDAVVCLSFSENSPNLLAVGMSKGALWVFDVSGMDFKMMHIVGGLTYDFVFVVTWWDDCIVWNNGDKILRLDRPFITSKTETVMKITHSSSKSNLSMMFGPKVTGLLRHPTNPENYVASGTDGALRYCNTNKKLEIVDFIPDAHLETISGIRSVPHCTEMFLTFGCDGTVKLWAWGVKKALIVFKTDENVVELCDACWSPLHATVVASCSASKIFIWDLQRRTHAPISITDTKFTCLNIQFSASGEFLIIGTADGLIMFLGLGWMPFPEKVKKVAFRNAIVREMILSGRQQECEKVLKHFSE